MKYKKTIYLSKQAEDKLIKISKKENKTQSNMIEQLIINHKIKTPNQ